MAIVEKSGIVGEFLVNSFCEGFDFKTLEGDWYVFGKVADFKGDLWDFVTMGDD